MTNKDNSLTLAQPEAAAAVISAALTTLTGATAYAETMLSEELHLAAQTAELKKTETVLMALLAEISRKRQDMERRQTALQGSRRDERYYRY